MTAPPGSDPGAGAKRSVPWTPLALLGFCFLMPIASWLAFGPTIPEGTFFLISRLGDSPAAQDPSNVVYSFARPPIFAVLGWTFWWPAAFLLGGWIAHALLMAVLVALAACGARQGLHPEPQGGVERRCDDGRMATWLAAGLGAAVVAAALPLGDLLDLATRGVSLIPHDAYHPFSFRTLFWIPIGLAFLAFGLGRPAAAAWLTAASCYIHPSAGLLALGLLSCGLLVMAARRPERRLVAHWLGAMLLGLAPSLLKLWLTALPAGSAEISYAAWYSSMIKDEADDFSFLYQVVFHRSILKHLFMTIGGILLVYALIVRRWWSEPWLWAAAAIPALFVAGAGIEYLLAVVVPTPVIHPLVALTPGYRLLSFAFFPLLVLLGRIAGRAVRLGNPSRLPRRVLLVAGSAIVLVMLDLTARGVENGNTGRALRYAAWAVGAGRMDGIEGYLEGARISGADAFVVPPIFHIAGPALIDPGQRDIIAIARQNRNQPERTPDEQALAAVDSAAFIDIVRRIRSAATAGEGLFVPPYLRFFRDALPDHPIFFQEHHDGNLMLGSPAFFGFWRPRMIDLLGADYETLPNKRSRLMYTAMRDRWLALDSADVQRLFQRYQAYPLLVTEQGHALDFEVMTRNQGFVVYDLRRPRAPAPVAERRG